MGPLNRSDRTQPSDLNAEHYKKHSSLQTGHADQILKELHILPENTVLDVGCGDGRNTAELAKRANRGHVTGLDVSQDMIQSAQQTFKDVPQLHFLLSSIEEASFAHPFDLITAFSCFHWFKEPGKVVEKLISHLKQGGDLVILTYPKESPYYQYLEKALDRYPDYKALSANHTMFSTKQYRDCFEKQHLNVLSFEEATIYAEYENTNALFNFIKGWVNNYVPLPDHLQEPFIHHVVQTILDDPNIQKKPTIKVPYTALVMRVQKPKKPVSKL